MCHFFIILTQVQPKHVKEAFRLLNKSIIRVEQPVINFDEEEDDHPVPMDDEERSQEKMDTNGDTAPSPQKDTQDDAVATVTKKKPGMHMSFEDYKQTSNLLVLYMRQEEEKEGKISPHNSCEK